jgi:hypothetical protein
MGTNDVRVDPKLNEALWERGIKNVPHRIRVKLEREFFSLVGAVTFAGLGRTGRVIALTHQSSPDGLVLSFLLTAPQQGNATTRRMPKRSFTYMQHTSP